MYDEILVPTDGSPGAENAAEHAAAIADLFDATIHALYVAEGNGIASVDGNSAPADDPAAVDEATELVAAAARPHEVPVLERVEEGDPEETILEYASEEDVDLIVVGSHGKTGLSRVLLGNTTEEIVRNADRPVTTVPPRDVDESSGETPVEESTR